MATSATYAITEFPNSKINAAVLANQVKASSISVNFLSIGTEVIEDVEQVTFYFDGDLLAGDIIILDNIVDNHLGTDFTVFPQKDVSEGESSDDSGNEVVKVALQNLLPAQGTYLLMWYQEISTTTTTGNSGARGILKVKKNSVITERGLTHNGEHLYRNMSGSFIFTINPEDVGGIYSFALYYRRIGVSGNAAKSQRGRIAVARIGQ